MDKNVTDTSTQQGEPTTAKASEPTEPSFLGDGLTKIAWVLLPAWLFVRHGGPDTITIVVPLASGAVLLYWTYWSFTHVSYKKPEDKLGAMAAWCWFIGIVNTGIGLLAKFGIWQPFPLDWMYQTLFGLGFFAIAMIVTSFKNRLTLITIFTAILVWGMDTIGLVNDIVFSKFRPDPLIYFMAAYHLIILNSMMQALRGIRGFWTMPSAGGPAEESADTDATQYECANCGTLYRSSDYR